jgi:hypothetical protein
VVDRAFAEGWRTAGDFLRHFGPRTLMKSLARDQDLRVRVLVETTHVNERLAARKTEASAAEDLALALDEGLTDADKLLALIPPDDRVRHLDADKLWAFLTEGWKVDKPDKKARDEQVSRITFIVEIALREGVLRLQDVADGIGFRTIATCLPHTELQRVVEHALSRAREGQRLTEEQLLEAVSLRSLMQHVPLEHTWNEIVIGKLARPLHFVPPNASPPPNPRRRTAPPPLPPNRVRATSHPPQFDPASLPESLLELQRGLQQAALNERIDREQADDDALEELTAVTEDDSEATQLHVEAETRVDVKAISDEEERHHAEASSELARVRAALQGLGRLPADTPEITLPILLSIESMYADLAGEPELSGRQSVVRDAFPNQTHLRTALIALVRLLDPGMRTTDAVLQHTDSESLIRTLLFEEQRLDAESERAHHLASAAPSARTPVGTLS